MSFTKDLLETRHLRILDVVLSEKSVSRAARRLGISQPAVSTALRDLREWLNDPLVVVSGKTLVLTEHAETLKNQVHQLLEDLKNISTDKRHFDPATTQQCFRIASPDNLSPEFLIRLFGQLRQEAPKSELECNSFGPEFDPFAALETGRYDIVLGNWHSVPENLYYSTMYFDEVVCLVRRGHPLVGHPMSIADYLAAEHVVLTPYAVAKMGVVDTYLSSHRMKRNVTISVPLFHLAPYALLETDLIFTVNSGMARYFAEYMPLVAIPSPLPFPRIQYVQLWHGRTHRSRGCKWLRQQLTQLAAECNHGQAIAHGIDSPIQKDL